MAEENSNDFYFDILLVALIIAAAALSILAFFSAQQNPYTMLYFNPNDLPQTAKAGQALSFSFFVENHEGTLQQYTYSVAVEGETKSQKTIELAENEKKQFSETIVLNSAIVEKQKVIVELAKPNSTEPYEIFFWVSVSQ